MKRARETIQSELQEARARYNALSQEWDTHPDVVSEREAGYCHQLEKQLPPELHALLMGRVFPNIGLLERLDVAVTPDYSNDSGELIEQWICTTRFAHHYNIHECDVLPSVCVPNARAAADAASFVPVSYHPSPVVLWERALASNPHVPEALAALCFACCMASGNDDALPVAAYPSVCSKGKTACGGSVKL